MDIELTNLEEILLYLETTSLEPHNDYTSEFTYKDQKILYKYIKELQQENKQLKDNWNELKEWASNFYNSEEVGWAGCGMRYTLEKIQELQGSDNK